MFAAFLTTIFFSISVICARRSAKLIGGTEANFWRLALAAVFLAAWAHGSGNGLSGDSFPLFLISGLIGIGIGDVALFQALPRLGSRLTLLLLQCLTAPCAALIEWVWLDTTLTASQILCGLIILSGVGLALAPGEHLHLPRRDLLTGLLASGIASLGGAYGMVLSRKAYEVAHAAGQRIDGGTAAYQRIIGGLFVAGVCLLAVKWQSRKIHAAATPQMRARVSADKWRRVWPWVIANGLLGQTLGVSCLQWALETTPTGLVLPIVAITPLVVIPFARRFEGERPGVRSLLGSAVAVAGAVALAILA